MTYHPDSVLVEKVAKAMCEEDGQKWEHVEGWDRLFWLRIAEAALSLACPLVAGVIADRLDEEIPYAVCTNHDGWMTAGAFVRSEFVDGEA